MRISLLLQREPFGSILERTLTGFFQSRFGRHYRVKWLDTLPAENPEPNRQLWLCNPYINAIFVPGVRRQTLLPVIQEFSRSTIWWKRPLQKAYVEMAVAPAICKWYARGGLEISPPLEGTDNLVLLGGNHHIRLLDYNEGKAFIIHKAGFNQGLMTTEIRVRGKNPYLPAPRIIQVGKNGTWYSEELILGTPINRLKNRDSAKEAVECILKPLFYLYDKTVQYVKVSDYIARVRKRIEDNVRAIPCFELIKREPLGNVLKALLKILEFSEGVNANRLAIAQTHGDFQPANILAGKSQTWLIDWEYTRMRQVAYDRLVFLLEARAVEGLSRRLMLAVNDELPEYRRMFADCPYVKWGDKNRRRFLIALFLLEDLDLRVMENSSPLFEKLNPSIETYLFELRNAVGIFGSNY